MAFSFALYPHLVVLLIYVGFGQTGSVLSIAINTGVSPFGSAQRSERADIQLWLLIHIGQVWHSMVHKVQSVMLTPKQFSFVSRSVCRMECKQTRLGVSNWWVTLALNACNSKEWEIRERFWQYVKSLVNNHNVKLPLHFGDK